MRRRVTWVLTVLSSTMSSAGISAFENPRGDQAENLPFACGESCGLCRLVAARAARGDELLD
jgi:hypothetical protein